MTTIISWNVNGLRSNIVDFNSCKYKKPRKIEESSPLDSIIKKYNPDLICLQETRLGKDNYELFESDTSAQSNDIRKYFRPKKQKSFPYIYWKSSQGEKSRSGNRYSGTSVWSKIKANKEI